MNTDLERIKQEIPIADLIGQTLTVIGKGNVLTTEEHDSLKIFTRTNSFTWYSQVGKQGKHLGGSPIDWVMHRDKCGEREAIQALQAIRDGGWMPPAPKVAKPKSLPAKQPETWQSPQWQAEARREVEKAQDTLWNQPEGEPGREYLQQRSIRPDMWLAWELGYGPAWNIKAQRNMPAIWIPWMNRQITAIQYRFLNVVKDDTTADRFGQRKGGKRYLCGLHLIDNEAETGQLNILFLVEGELNAVAIFQAIYGMYAADVVSFGPQSNITNAEVARMAATVATRYKRVIVWADEPENALAGIGILPATVKTLAVRSPLDTNGNKLDANDLLCSGKLEDVIFGLIQEITQ